MHTIRHNYSFDSKLCLKTLNTFQNAWNKAKDATLLKLKKIGNIDKKAGQLIYRAMGDGNKQTLTLHILKGFAKETGGKDKIWLEAGYHIRYPN